MSRFDHRTKQQFADDIYFATAIEKYFWEAWVSLCSDKKDIMVTSPRDNGVGNDGAFIASGDTSGADYMADIDYLNVITKDDHPIEIKWVPTFGKVTLKKADVKAYLKEGCSILFIYPCKDTGINLRKPRNPTKADIPQHIEKIESVADSLRWGLLTPEGLSKLNDFAEKKGWQQIRYMGNKHGVVIPHKSFTDYWCEEKWSN
jgi:hypothetical protein